MKKRYINKDLHDLIFMSFIAKINLLRRNLSGKDRDILIREVVSDECSRVLYENIQRAFALQPGNFRRASDYCERYRFSKT